MIQAHPSDGPLQPCPLRVSYSIYQISCGGKITVYNPQDSTSILFYILGACVNRTITKYGSAESCQALLQQFNIKGSSTVDRMFASNNFTQFAALDDAGIAYILQEVEVPSLYR